MLETVQLIALAIALFGGLFKLMHWPGANILLLVGLSSLALYYIIMGFVSSAEAQNGKERLLGYGRNFAIAVLLMGGLFKLMHWPGANLMIIDGAVGLGIALLFQAFSSSEKREE